MTYSSRKSQNEIDRYLRLVPLITRVDNARVRERLEVIEKDQREYILDDEDQKVQTVILKPEPDKEDAVVLKKSLSRSYPNLPFNEALEKEKEKLKLELQRSQANLDKNQCEVIQSLLDVTQTAVYFLPEKCSPEKSHKKVKDSHSDDNSDKGHASDEKYNKKHDTSSTLRSSVSGKDLLPTECSYQLGEWHTGLLSCCSEPSICMYSPAVNYSFIRYGHLRRKSAFQQYKLEWAPAFAWILG